MAHAASKHFQETSAFAPAEGKGASASFAPQAIRISSKRQITIPSKLYKDKGFSEYAWIEETEEGLLIKPVSVDDEDVSLCVLRKLLQEGLEGEELIERYKEACPRVVSIADACLHAQQNAEGRAPCAGGSMPARTRETERAHVLQCVADAAVLFPAIRRAYVFGSFARGTFSDESDVDVRIEYESDGSFRLRELAQLQKRIEQDTGRSADVVTARALKNEGLAAAIERDKVLVYEREE